jgi:hypothetical protein
MSDPEIITILTQAIEMAEANNWGLLDGFECSIHKAGGYSGWVLCVRDNAKQTKTHIGIAEILYNQDFANALWGECTTWVKSKHGTVDHIPLNGWQYHLQKMVITDNPLNYLAKHLPKGDN